MPENNSPNDTWVELLKLVREELRDLMKEVAMVRVEVGELRVRNEKVAQLENRVAALELSNQHLTGQREVTAKNLNWLMGIGAAIIGAVTTAAILYSWRLK